MAELSVQHAVARVLAEAPTLQEAAHRILQAVCESLGWALGAVWHVDRVADVMRCVDVWHRREVEAQVAAFVAVCRERTFTRGVGLPGRIWGSGEPAWIVDVVNDPNFPRAKVAAAADLHAAFGFPIRLGSELLGIMEFFSREIQAPDDDLLAMMASIGSHVGQFIERKRAEEAVRASEARKSAILDTALDCIVTMTHDGRITEFNPAAERTFGYRREEVLGRELADVLIPPRLRDRHRASLARYLATGEATVLGRRIEMSALRADGTEFPVELAITRIAFEGPAVFTGFIRDITERKRVEEEHAGLLRREHGARAAAEAANRSKDEFVAMVSHELRTPLQAMLGWTRMLRAGELDEATTSRALETIERNARAQTQLIEDLLDVSRITSGKLRLDVRSVELASVIEAAVDAIQPAADARDIRVQTTLDPRAAPISGDPDRLQQVVWNLLSNAVKFTPPGGRVDVRLLRAGSQVEVVVGDSGIGIAPEFLPHVFERFRQADGAGARPRGGLGLGLTIARHLVEQHGGTIRADSPGENQGTTFRILLPLMADSAEPRESRRAYAATPLADTFDRSRLGGVRVLVVEDEPDARELLSTILTSAGAEVRLAASVEEALERLVSWTPDAIVSDINLPGESGYGLIRRIRKLPAPAAARVPAIALTAFARLEDRIRALSAGFQMHVPKPVEPAELVAVVAAVVGRPEESS